MNLYDYSREVSRKSGSNFYWSFFFLPKAQRDGIFSVYAFSRLVDDAVDEAPDPEKARREIRLWRRRLTACFNGSYGDLSHPILPELSLTIRRFGIPATCFEDLLTGVEMDLAKKRYPTFAELETYCYHVAGTIGLVCNHLFGQREEQARRYAVLLGTAFQLTNIIRDVGSDAKRGRIYLPQDELARFQVPEAEILEGKPSPSFYELMRFQAGRARDYFRQASRTIPERQRRKIVPAQIMAAFYRRLLEKIEEENFPVFEKKVRLSGWEKVCLTLKALLRSKW